jgi:hypothetical protein
MTNETLKLISQNENEYYTNVYNKYTHGSFNINNKMYNYF